ncbi:MAG: signal peptidase II [Myxococcales bacterium]|nr:signal peptidase II [Myxococcales bacterium]
MPRRWKIFLIVAMITLVADHASKYWARNSLDTHPAGCAIPADIVAHKCVGVKETVIDGYWDWRLSFNPGSAFGLFDSQDGARVFLSIVGILAVAAMVFMVKKAKDEQRLLAIALGLVAGGAVGNLLDRMYFGVVTDFVLWHYHAKEWPVFNVADVALVIGVGMMFFDVGGDGKQDKAKRQAKAAARAERIAKADAEDAAAKAKADAEAKADTAAAKADGAS